VATLEAFKYLGMGTVIERSRPEVDINFSLLGSAGDAGDQYAGLDRFGRVVAHNWFEGTSTIVIDGYGYTYDRGSNRLTRSNALDADFSETYTNDALGQLESYVRGDGGTPATTQDWEFDALGNWTTFTTDGVAEAREANAQNELTDVGGAALTYSATGNLTTDAEGRELAYDAWNRLVSVYDVSSTLVARYEYDGMNRRIVEQVGTLADPDATSAPVRDLFYSFQWQVLEERVRDGLGDIPADADTRYIWSPVYVDAMIARDRNADANAGTGTDGLEERVYALQDANWNTTAIVAATGVSGLSAGEVVNRFVYTPYGEHEVLDAAWDTLTSSPATPWAHLFQGLKLTEITNLFYVRNRDYSASLGRFIERDPIGFNAGDNNWYRFVGNAPSVHVDPQGLCCGDCMPPAPGQPTEKNKKVVDMRITPAGVKPGYLDNGFNLLEDLERLDDVLKIINLAVALTQGTAEQLNTLIDEYTEDAADLKGLAPKKMNDFIQAWQKKQGYGIFMVVEYQACVPCSCAMSYVDWQQRYEWQSLTKYHQCTEGTGTAKNPHTGIYAGNTGMPPTRAVLERCAQAAIK
jgi:RHS repeat-associated protein